MIRFIYGNPGTGKTEEIYRMLESDALNHRNALLIVPEQMTVSVEREVIKRLPPSAQLHIEVLNYTRLANKIFRERGGVAYNFCSAGLQKLLMWRALMVATPFLSEYCRTGNDDIALADSFLATYNELTAAGIPLEQLEDAAKSMTESTITGKLKDIVTVCSIYTSLLSSYSDNNSELIRLAELLKSTVCLKGTNVYFDGFSSITGVEHSITKSIFAQADNCAITIGIPSPTYKGTDTVSIRRFSDHLRRDCAALGKRTETVILTENHRTSSEALTRISSGLWEITADSADSDAPDTDDSVQLYRAADVYDECEYAAATVRRLVESGYKYNEIVIIARNSDKYRGIIEPSLETMDIPYYLSEKTDPSLCPLAKLILSALRVTIFGWQRNDVISHLKTGLCNVDARDADVFEAYTEKWNIKGKQFTSPEPWNMNPDGYTTQKTERGEKALAAANEVKNTFIPMLSEYSASLKASEDVRSMCLATVEYLDKLEIRESLKNLAARYLSHDKPRQAEECVKMYDVVLDSLECVCDAFSDAESFDLMKFYTAVKTALEESELGSIPTSQDEVTIGSANMLRENRVKCAIILGACDGEFPANAQSSGLLSDVDRDHLLNHNVTISGDREMRASDELYFFRRAASSPSEKLIVFTRADSEPSIAFTRLKKVLGDPKVTETAENPLVRFGTVKSIREYLPLYEDTDIGTALGTLLDEFDTNHKNAIRYNDPISAENDAITAETVASHVGKAMRMSQSRIEEFIKCKFAYSCKYYLKLEENRRISFAYNNIGSFVHKILEKFLFCVFVTNKGVFPQEDKKVLIVNEIIESYVSELIPDRSNAGARLIHLIERLKKMSLLILDDILSELSDSDFTPSFFEMKIGTDEVPSISVDLKNGTRMYLNGVADRVDIFESGDKAYVRVVDYKTGSKTFSLSDLEEGKNLQLLIYLFSLTRGRNAKTFGGKTPVPAGITYISTSAGKVKSERYDSEAESLKAASDEIKRSGLILDDEEVLSAVSRSQNSRYLMSTARKKSAVSEEVFNSIYEQVCEVLKAIGNDILTGNANAIPKDGADTCKYCRYSHICRASHKN